MAPAILLIGLPLEGIADPELFKKISKGIEEVQTTLSKAGYELRLVHAAPKVGNEEVIEAITSLKWDAVVIGFGMRGMPEHTVFFEWLVNEVKDKAPQAKIGFNVDPESTLDCVKRLVPV
ncbi:hypothetical protein BDY19DRAFT_956004 [Irpex rosettiformis]|uniref:Uncharacterized protein n=1 Tax=Irpex rosettiformis TaxID=378272 RepID=A0ACB8TYK2_9APHY|nr:hypothetical protein BDY19DRAFT_956004 [Irpex rosettiformis]